MKTLNLISLFLLFSLIAYSQKQSVEFSIECKDGNLLKQDADVYSMGPIKISGLKSNSDYEKFEKLVKKQSIVKKFEYIPETNQKESKIAVMSFSTNNDNEIESFFKTINLSKLNINDRSFTLNQKEEIKAYLKELKNKHSEKQLKEKEMRNADIPTPRQANQ